MLDMDARRKRVQDYDDACDAYEKTFNRTSPYLIREMNLEDATVILRRCVEKGKPYRAPYPNMPVEAREFLYTRDDYEAMFGRGSFPSEVTNGLSFEEMTEIMRQCMKEGKPYKEPELPEGAIS